MNLIEEFEKEFVTQHNLLRHKVWKDRPIDDVIKWLNEKLTEAKRGQIDCGVKKSDQFRSGYKDVKIALTFAKNIAKAFNDSGSSNVYYYMQQGYPDICEWTEVQELLNKIMEATASF